MTMTLKGRADVSPEPQLELDPVEVPVPRGHRWLPIAIVATLAPAIGLGVWWYFAAGPGAYTTVPDGLVDASAVDAEAALTSAGLDVLTIEEFHPNVPAGQVIATSVEEGAEIRKDGVITVTISKGPDLREVWVEGPGLPLEEVEHALLAAGFGPPRVEHAYSDTVPAGVVMAVTDQSGKAVAQGATFPVGAVLILTCSDGLEPVTVPNVVGMTGEAAVAALKGAGLQVTSSKAYSPTVAAGVVMSQSPVAGTEGFRLDTVAIVISKGPQPVEATTVRIPSSIIGMGKFAALDLLASKGFVGKYQRNTCTLDWSQCVVKYTVPAAGTYQPKGSAVTIYLTNPSGVAATGTIPTLVGLYKYPAWDLIYSSGFTGTHIDDLCTLDYDQCVVYKQDPAPGTVKATGTLITIWLKDKPTA